MDDIAYTGTANGLMTWALNTNEVYTDPGPILKGIFEDFGWTIVLRADRRRSPHRRQARR